MSYKTKIAIRAAVNESTGKITRVIPNGTVDVKAQLLPDESLLIVTNEMLDKLNYFAKTE